MDIATSTRALVGFSKNFMKLEGRERKKGRNRGKESGKFWEARSETEGEVMERRRRTYITRRRREKIEKSASKCIGFIGEVTAM